MATEVRFRDCMTELSATRPDLCRIGEAALSEVLLDWVRGDLGDVRREPSREGARHAPALTPSLSRPTGEGARRAGEGTPSGFMGTEQARQGQDALPAPGHLVSAVSLTGERVVVGVALRLPRAFVASAVHRLTGHNVTESDSDSLLTDAAGELTNMVAGRVAAQLATHGFSCSLGTPTVSCDAAWPVETGPGTDCGQVELACDGQPLSLAVQCRYANP